MLLPDALGDRRLGCADRGAVCPTRQYAVIGARKSSPRLPTMRQIVSLLGTISRKMAARGKPLLHAQQ